MDKKYSVDVAVIGGGIMGTAAVRELSRYQVSTLLIEQQAEVGWGTTKANSGIVHAGFHDTPGSKKAHYCVRGNALYPKLCEELDVNFRQNGIFMVARDDEEVSILEEYLRRGEENGVPGVRILSREEALAKEPHLSSSAKAALEAPSGGVVAPFELAAALMENAQDNGAQLLTEAQVQDVKWEEDHFVIQTSQGIVEARFVVNAAGLFGDNIARMVGDTSFTIAPRKGEEYLMDKTAGALVSRTIFPVPNKLTKGILVIPTVDGNLMIGPTGDNIEDRDDLATTLDGFQRIFQGVSTLVEGVDPSKVIAPFAGVRAASDRGDFILESSAVCPQMIHVAGMESPGLTAAPAIAEDVIELLKEQGLTLVAKDNFQANRRPLVRFHTLERDEQAAIIAENPLYGRIICRCETVTEGEIVDAISRGARTLDGVKFRVRAGAGRCQGGFCMPMVIQIIARELGIPVEEVTKRGGKTYQILAKAKDYLKQEVAQ